MNIPGFVVHPSSHTQLDAFASTPAHAVLLSGPEGTGKTHIATALSAQLLGVPPTELDHHAYFRIVTPKNNTIAIEQIRELITFFRLKVPGPAPIKRIAIVQDAEAMSTEAQNALLKLLEEPPIDSILILTSSHSVRLLTTIRSRLQHLQLSAPAKQDVLQHFVASGHNEAEVKAALLRADTNIAAAKHLLEIGGDGSDTPITLVKQALGVPQYERLLLVDGLAKQKDQARLFTDTLAVVAAASLEAAAAKGATTMSRWRDILQAAYTAQDALERSANAKLVLTELMLAL